MSNFFIIGNGFDCHHGLKTEFRNFEKYISVTYPHLYGWLDMRFSPLRKGEYWKDIETCLANCSYDTIVDEAYAGRRSLSESDSYWGDLQYNLSVERDNFCQVKKALDEWINQIESEVKTLKPKNFPFRENDLYLTFNYTSTLETVYRIPSEKILHIHGTWERNSKVLGHNVDSELDIERLEDHEYPWIADEANSILEEMPTIFYKNSPSLISDNREFFEYVTHAAHIVFMGWSIGKQDILYLDEIGKKIPTTAGVTVLYYSEGRLPKLKNKLSRVIDLKRVRFLSYEEYLDESKPMANLSQGMEA